MVTSRLYLFIFLSSISNQAMIDRDFSLVGSSNNFELRSINNFTYAEPANSSCTTKGTCFHSAAAYSLNIFLLVALVVFALRLLRSTKLGEVREQQSCGSALIFFGSGSSCFSQCGSGSTCFLNADPDLG